MKLVKCLNCGKELEKQQKKFCSRSCAAHYNNTGRKHTDETKEKIAKSLLKNGEYIENVKKQCPICGKLIENKHSKYCSIECFQEAMYNKKIEEWKSFPEKFNTEETSSTLKKYFMRKYNCKCQKCGWGEVNEYTGKIPLHLHHKDGNCTNNKEENLQLLCPNCHSLTENFGSLNKNSKRYKLKQYKKLIK